MIRKTTVAVMVLMLGAGAAATATAETVRVAVAANFAGPAKALQGDFEKLTGDKLVLSFGATGGFYAQIKNGAPFDVLLAADAKTPAKALREGFGVPGSSFTYAVGRLAFWSAAPGLVTDGNAVELLKGDALKKIAVANPKLAPYGLAAHEVLAKLGLASAVASKIVEGDSIGKTYQYVASGNAQAGFVALSQCAQNGRFVSGSGWIVPTDLYSPIMQDAVLLKAGERNEGAKRFLEFLKTSPQADRVRQAFGYGRAE